MHMLVSLGRAPNGHLMFGLILAVGMNCPSLDGRPWVSLCAQVGGLQGTGDTGLPGLHRFHLLENGCGGCLCREGGCCLLGRCVLSLGPSEFQCFSDTTSKLVFGEAAQQIVHSELQGTTCCGWVYTWWSQSFSAWICLHMGLFRNGCLEIKWW